MFRKPYTRRIIVILSICLLQLHVANAQLFRLSHARGYTALSTTDKAHFAPFSIQSIYQGMNVGNQVQEISVPDILNVSKYFERTVVILHNVGGKVHDFPLTEWEELQDTLLAHNSRLVVVTGRYDGYEKLSKALATHPLNFEIYVLNGAKYTDDYRAANKLFWNELLKNKVPRKERREYNQMMVILDKNGLKTFLPFTKEYIKYIFF